MSDVQQQVPDLRVCHPSRANNVLRAAKGSANASYLIRAVAPGLTPQDARFELSCVREANFAQQPDGGSQQGLLLLLGGHGFNEHGGPANMVEWG